MFRCQRQVRDSLLEVAEDNMKKILVFCHTEEEVIE